MDAFFFDPEGFLLRLLAFLGGLILLHGIILYAARIMVRDGFLAGILTMGIEFALSACLMACGKSIESAGLMGFSVGGLLGELSRHLRMIGKI